MFNLRISDSSTSKVSLRLRFIRFRLNFIILLLISYYYYYCDYITWSDSLGDIQFPAALAKDRGSTQKAKILITKSSMKYKLLTKYRNSKKVAVDS